MTRRLVLVVWWWLGLVVLGSPAVADERPRLDFAGCTEVLDGPVCLLDEARRVRLFVTHSIDATIGIEPDPGVHLEPVMGGSRVEIEVPDGVMRIRVDVLDDAGRHRLALSVRPTPSKPSWLAHASALRRAGHVESARQIAEGWTTRGSLSARGRAYGLLAYYQDRAGEVAEAEASRLAAIDALQRAGRIGRASLQRAQLHASMLQARRFAAAEALEVNWPIATGDAISIFDRLYSRGRRHQELGSPRRALAELLSARTLAHRIGLTTRLFAAEDARAALLVTSGRHAEAQAVSICLAASHGAALHPCAAARLLNNVAWSRLLERDADPRDPWRPRTLDTLCPDVTPPDDTTELDLLLAGVPRPMLERALQRFEAECPRDIDAPINVRMNLAFADLQAGLSDRASASLDALRDQPSAHAEVVLWDVVLRARLALLDGRPHDALTVSGELDRAARKDAWPEGRWRAAVLRARALDALGRFDKAIDEHDAAEALLDSELMRLPRHDGRIDLPHLRRRAVGHHLDLLIDRGRNDDAFRVARRSRSRFARSLLRSVDDEALQRTGFLDRRDAIDAQLATSADWSGGHLRRLQADAARDLALLRSELDAVMAGGRPITVVDRQPVDGELSLTVHPGEASWWLFASSVDGIDVFRLDDLDALFDQQRDGTGNPDQLAEEWADRLLTPVAARLRAARSVRFLAYGVLHAIDLHALPFDGAPLIEQVTVAYGVDLPTVKRDGELGPSVVIGDPSGDLAAARNEAAQVFRLLQPFGAIHHLDGLAATGAVVRQHLDGADHVHYAGHAHFAGWDSHLLLADGSSLTVDDILALRRPPRTVVLASCEAGRAVAAGGRETFDLARAFATAGSTAVIAATRPVSDEVTGRLMSTLYDAWTGSGGLTGDAAAALRQAQRRLRETDPDADWAAFRLIER